MLRLPMVSCLASSLLLLAACGSDDNSGDGSDAAAAKYFTDFAAISDDGQAQIAELGDKYPDAFEGEVQQTKDSYGEYVIIFDDTVSRFEDLEVPAELRELHGRGIDANQDLSAISHERLDRLDAASTSEEVDEIFAEDPEFTDAVASTDTFCEEIQDRAATYDIELDLDCEK